MLLLDDPHVAVCASIADMPLRKVLALACLAVAHGGRVATGKPVVGLRAWVNDEAITMLETAVRPVRARPRFLQCSGVVVWLARARPGCWQYIQEHSSTSRRQA
jgi:hypothetical protein